jgi:fucose permease
MISDVMIRRMDRSAFATMFIFAAATNVLPICLVKISEELSINLTQAGMLGFLTSMEQFFVLILSIFAAARYGKIRIIRFAMLVLTTGLVAFSFSRSYAMAVGLIMVVGFGNAVLEALMTPLVADLHPNDSGSKMNLLHAFWPIGVCVGVLVIGEMLSRGLSWRVAFAGLAVFVLAISLTYPRASVVPLPPSKAGTSHFGEILKTPRFWLLGFAMFFSGSAELAFAYWSASYIQLHFNALPRAGALGAAAFAVGMVAGRFYASRLARKVSLKKIITISSLSGFVVSFGFFLITTPAVIYIYLFIMGLFVACLWPSIQSYSAQVIKVDPTALMVFLSCFGIPGASVAILLMGIIGDHYGLRAAYIAAPAFLLLVVLFMLAEGRAAGHHAPAHSGQADLYG